MAQQVYALNMNYNSGGQFAANVFHYQFDDAGYATTAQAAAALCVAWTTNNFVNLRNILPTAVTILSAKARRITNGGGFEGIDQYASANTGTRTGQMMATGVGPVLIWYGIANSPKRGRQFLPGITNTDASDGQIQTGLRTAIATYGAQMVTPFTLAGGSTPTATFGLFSRAGNAFTIISTGQLSDMLGQIRRRQLPD